MEIIYCIIFFCAGILISFLFSILFIRNDKQWVNIVTIGGSVGGLIGAHAFLVNSLSINDSNHQAFCLLSMLVSFLFFSGVFLWFIISKVIKKQTEKVKLRILDIVLGYNRMLEDYYANRQHEIDHMLNIDELTLKSARLEELIAINSKMEENINEQQKDKLHILLKVDFKLILSRQHIVEIPSFIENLCEFVYQCKNFTSDFINKFEKTRITSQAFDAYFIYICSHINAFFFRTNPKKARTHVRLLDESDKTYKKIVSVEGTDTIVKKAMTDIPSDVGMIYHANMEKASLIKSVNNSLHYGSIDKKWVNYITIPMYDLEYNNSPFLSMGISVQDGAWLEYTLVFLSFLKIEVIIQEQLKLLDEQYNIMEIYKKGE